MHQMIFFLEQNLISLNVMMEKLVLNHVVEENGEVKLVLNLK